MNHAGEERCHQLQRIRYDEGELLRRLTLTKMMSTLCHCSAELDPGTLLFYSVNHIFLSSGSFLLLLFSETSPPSSNQLEGLDVYGRMYLYTLIEEEVRSKLEGHFNCYSSEIDGRLAVLLVFNYGLNQDFSKGLIQHLENECLALADELKAKYDIHIVSYLSEIIDDIKLTSYAYDKMQATITLHRYLNAYPSPPIYRLTNPGQQGERAVPFDPHAHARAISNALVEDQDYTALTKQALTEITDNVSGSVDELKARFGDFFEALCNDLYIRGIRFNIARKRNELLMQMMTQITWEHPYQWMLQFVEDIHQLCQNDSQALTSQKLDEARDYIQTHLSDPNLSPQSVSEAIHLSSAKFAKLFREQLTVPPAKYIRDARLEHALTLLQEGNMGVAEISDACGFGSMETFHRAFKSRYGMSPGKMKKANEQV